MFTLIKKLHSCLIILFILSFQHNCIAQQAILERGISLKLATQRASTISDISYSLSFAIPEKIIDPITAQLVLKLNLHKTATPLILDLNTTADHIHSIENTKGDQIAYKFINEHLIIPVSVLKQGVQSFKISFTAGDQSLNRNKEYLYTLFVPARASTAFPCFD